MLRVYIERITDLVEVGNSQSAAAKALLCKALREDFGICGELEFSYGAHGKPYLVAPSGVWFNVSHSGDYAACAVSDEGDVGVDIQKITPARMRVAEQYFAPQHFAELLALSGAARDERFCELWVLREAEIKARGGSVLERGATYDVARLIDAPEGYCVAICVM